MTMTQQAGPELITGGNLTQLITQIVSEVRSSDSLLAMISEGEDALRASIVDTHDIPHHPRFEAEWPEAEVDAAGRLAISTELLRVDQRAAEGKIRDLRRGLKPYDGARIRVVGILPEVAPIAVMHEWRNEWDSWHEEPRLTRKRHIAVAEGKLALDRSVWWGEKRALPLLRRGVIELTEPGRRRDRIADNVYHAQVVDPASLTPQLEIILID